MSALEQFMDYIFGPAEGAESESAPSNVKNDIRYCLPMAAEKFLPPNASADQILAAMEGIEDEFQARSSLTVLPEFCVELSHRRGIRVSGKCAQMVSR